MILGKLVLMRLVLRALIIISVLAILSAQALAEAEVAIAMRYLQAAETSHSHLYLYREDGKLLRQLTNDNSGQDSGPIFAPDGVIIVFMREKPRKRPRILEYRSARHWIEKAGSGAGLVHPSEELALFHKRRTGGISIAESDSVIRGICVACRGAATKLQIAG
jgi:hypothetical protein